MRTKLLNEQYEDRDNYDEYQDRIDEIESILNKIYNVGKLTLTELNRAREIVKERQFQRYTTCLNSGLSEQVAGGAFDD